MWRALPLGGLPSEKGKKSRRPGRDTAELILPGVTRLPLSNLDPKGPDKGKRLLADRALTRGLT